jgi:hypothetical protein
MNHRPIDTATAQLRAAVRSFYAWIGSMALLAIAPLVAFRLIDVGTTPARVAAVLIGVGGTLPWMWVAASIIRRGDEFVRRVHLVALAWAFGGAMLLIVALAWLVRAGFMDDPDLFVVWLGLLVAWFAAMAGAKRHFERAR